MLELSWTHRSGSNSSVSPVETSCLFDCACTVVSVRFRGFFIVEDWVAILKQGLLGQFAQMGSEIEDSSPLCRCGEVVQQCGIPALTSSGFQQWFHRCGKGVVRIGSIYGAHALWRVKSWSVLVVNTPWVRLKGVDCCGLCLPYLLSQCHFACVFLPL